MLINTIKVQIFFYSFLHTYLPKNSQNIKITDKHLKFNSKMVLMYCSAIYQQNVNKFSFMFKTWLFFGQKTCDIACQLTEFEDNCPIFFHTDSGIMHVWRMHHICTIR